MFIATPLWAMPAATDAPDWYYPQWLAEAPHAPVFKVRDTVNCQSARNFDQLSGLNFDQGYLA